uniref:Putative transcription factor 5qnca n=1 Tax=Ixodes ricinus TaxID=34613 RepID=A0A0K8R562_IXORI
MEFETVDYTDEMVIVKNNGKGTTANRKLTTHSYIMYIYIFIGKYIYIFMYISTTLLFYMATVTISPAWFIVIILEARSPEKCSTYRGRSVSIRLQHK